jgi:ABC-type amino acid transport substrate-binding protein
MPDVDLFSLKTSSRRRGAVLLLALMAILALLAASLLRPGGPLARDAVWARVQERGVWRVAMDPSFPPFESLDAAGQPIGLDVDLVNEIARRMGVRAQITTVGFDELVDAVAAQRVDAAVSALPEMPWRTREVAFTRSYIDAGLVLAVLAAPAGSPITGAEDLPGKRVAAEWGSQGDALARELASSGEERAFELALQETADAALQAVIEGRADAAIVDAVTLALFDSGGEPLRTAGPSLQPDPYVVYVPVSASRLLEKVNTALQEMEEDGTLEAIRSRWMSP